MEKCHDIGHIPLHLRPRRLHQPQRAPHQINPPPVQHISRQVLNIHRVLGADHLARADRVQDLCILVGGVGLEHLGRLGGLRRHAGLGVVGHADSFELGEDLLLFGLVCGTEGLEAEVDGFADFGLGELALDVGGALDD